MSIFRFDHGRERTSASRKAWREAAAALRRAESSRPATNKNSGHKIVAPESVERRCLCLAQPLAQLVRYGPGSLVRCASSRCRNLAETPRLSRPIR
jgi:hypothetical protein